LSCPSSLPGHSDFPAPVVYLLPVSPDLRYPTATRAPRRRRDLRSYLRYLSSHAAGLTPGPPQVLMPFASLQIIAFSGNVVDRRVFRPKRICSSTGLSQQYPSGLNSRSCTIHLTLRPAILAGPPDWVRPAIQQAVSGHCRGKFSPHVATRTRPQPTYPKGQSDMITSLQVTR
jgi:hypothetical protein